MSVPKPAHPLTGHCAAIFSDTLFVYDSNNFQSLPLNANATWSVETVGHPVTSPACVTVPSNSGPSGESLWVIGGDTADYQYLGLQRYFFRTRSWETLYPPADVFRTRTNHSVAYLSDSQSILVYGGSPSYTPNDLSSQTFLVSTQSPFNIRSYVSYAPPTNNAILQPWNSSHAVLAGGNPASTDIWLFGPDQGWQRFATSLASPLRPADRGLVVDGSDGSKVLQVYSMDVSPNTVSGIVLREPGGAPALTGHMVGAPSSRVKRARDLAINRWPQYNNQNAPRAIRQDYSVTSGSQGLVVLAGGSTDDPVVMFNQADNSWIKPAEFFAGKHPLSQQPSNSATAVSPVASSTSYTSSTSAANSKMPSPKSHTSVVLGVTLGVIFGIIAMTIIMLLIYKCRKAKPKRRTRGPPQRRHKNKDIERLSFADRGAPPMNEAGPASEYNQSSPSVRGPSPRDSFTTISRQAGAGPTRSPSSHRPRGSFESSRRLVRNDDGNIVRAEQHEMTDVEDRDPPSSSTLAVPGAVADRSSLAVPGAVADGSSLDRDSNTGRKRSSGWSKYFAATQPTGPHGVSHIPSAYVKPDGLSPVFTAKAEDQMRSRILSSALVSPLLIGKTIDGQRISNGKAQASPSALDTRDDFERPGNSTDVRDGQRGVGVNPSRSKDLQPRRSRENRSTFGSNAPSEYSYHRHTPWSPMGASASDNASLLERERRPSRGRSAGFFPGAGTSYMPPKTQLSQTPRTSSGWSSPRTITGGGPGRTESNMTVFPNASDFPAALVEKHGRRAKEQAGHGPSKSRPNNDMSWLNLDLNKD